MEIREVVSFILVKGGSILVERRSMDKTTCPGEIVIPVGKIESGETKEQAMLREAEEELSVTPTKFRLLCVADSEMNDHIARISYFLIDSWDGNPTNNEADEIMWIPLNEAKGLPGPADKIAVRKYIESQNNQKNSDVFSKSSVFILNY